MAIELNHTIVHVKDKNVSATFIAEILGLKAPEPFSHFLVVRTDNGVSLDYADSKDKIFPQHYAFLVSESEFDQIFARILSRGLTYWPDPMRSRENEINTRDEGRGLYFEGPSGHFYEVMTRPYGYGK